MEGGRGGVRPGGAQHGEEARRREVGDDPDGWAPPASETERGVESGLAGPTRPQGKREKG